MKDPTTLYKYMPSRFVDSFMRGDILFRSLSYFRKEEDRARGDEIEGIHVDDPDNAVTLTILDTGRSISGDFSMLTSIDQENVFALCASLAFRDDLFIDFCSDSCIVIKDPSVFFLRCRTGASRVLSLKPPGFVHQSVEYFRPNCPVTRSIEDPRHIPFFKHHTFERQEEYRGVFARRNGFRIEKRITNRLFDIREEINKTSVREETLHIGSLSGIAEVRHR